MKILDYPLFVRVYCSNTLWILRRKYTEQYIKTLKLEINENFLKIRYDKPNSLIYKFLKNRYKRLLNKLNKMEIDLENEKRKNLYGI